jgi:hydroxyacylglutathione hydrolase
MSDAGSKKVFEGVLPMKEGIMLEEGFTNRCLLPCNEGYLLVEAGSAKEFSLFLRQLKERGITAEEIKYLFLTHHHEDHAGFTSSLRQASGCRIITHREASEPLQKGEPLRTRGGLVNRRVIVLTLYLLLKEVRLSFTPVELEETDILVEGDDNELLRSLGVPGKILHTPGHSPDSISLLLDDGSCFCGDAAMNNPAWLDTRCCCIFVSDIEEYYRSWQK